MKPSRVLGAVHAFMRAPHYRSIPSASPSGVVVNRDMLQHQFRDLYKTLQHSTLVDKVHLMTERPGMDALRVADMLACVGPSFIAMPHAGVEHRIREFMDTMRYVRGAGGPTTLSPLLQDLEQCRAHSGDLVCLPHGIAMAHGSRTNAAAHQAIREAFEHTARETAELRSYRYDPHLRFEVFSLEQEADAPPLGDYFGFAGNNVLIAWKDEHGLLAVDQYQQQAGDAPEFATQTVYLEPGCHFFSFFGVDYTADVLVQKGYERSMDSLAAAGLNPIPVQWSEMDKLGISMRSAILPLKFLQTNVNGMISKSSSSARNRGGRWQSHQLKK